MTVSNKTNIALDYRNFCYNAAHSDDTNKLCCDISLPKYSS